MSRKALQFCLLCQADLYRSGVSSETLFAIIKLTKLPDTHALELIAKLDGLPLALATAGAYLSQVSTSFEDYIRLYNNSWLKLQQTTPGLLSYEDRALYTTWNVTHGHIQSQNESAGKLLKLLAYFDNQDVWYDLLAAGREGCPEWFAVLVEDELSFNEVIRLLCDHGFIEATDASQGYSMHTCVHAWTIHVLNTEIDISMATLALRCVRQCYENQHKWRPLCRRLLPHALLSSKFVDKVFYSLNSSRDQRQSIIVAIENLSCIFHNAGKFDEFELMLETALEFKRKVFGPKDVSTLFTALDLKITQETQGISEEDSDIHSRVPKFCQNIKGPEQSMAFHLLSKLADSYAKQGKAEEAELLCLQVLEGFFKAQKPMNISVASTVITLGRLYTEQERMEEAEVIFRLLLDVSDIKNGPLIMCSLAALNYISQSRCKQEDMKEAEALQQRALNTCTNAFGPESEITLNTMYNSGVIYLIQGKIKEAEAILRQLLEGYEKFYSPEHTKTKDLARLLYLLQRMK